MTPSLAFSANAIGVAIMTLFGLLAIATLYVLILRGPGSTKRELTDRIQTWWIIFAVLAGGLVAGPSAVTVIIAFVSFLALKEFFSMIPTRRADRMVLFVAYLSIPIQYALIANGLYGIFIVFIPVYMLLAVPAIMAWRGDTRGFLKAAATVHWGLMACVFAIGHAAALLTIEPGGDRSIGAGLFLVLMILTGINDVGQYVAGKALGSIKIAPAVSPNKTLAGLLGGIGITALVAALVAPLLTPFSMGFSALLGGGLAVAGFLGDLTLSGVKRDLGIKDTGTILPGHGGILDRIDSLVFTAPLFFHLSRFFYF